MATDAAGQTRRYVSLYLPPGQQRQILDTLVGTLRWAATPTVVCGDFNLQLESPREGEEPEVATMRQLLATLRLTPVPSPHPTHRGRHAETQIDYVAVPDETTWQ